MKNSLQSDSFDILNFSGYRQIEGQYSDEFIKSCGAVKLSETESQVEVAVKKSERERSQRLLKSFHGNKQLCLVEIKNADFEEFVGKILEGSDELSKVSISKKSGNCGTGDLSIEKSSSSNVINTLNSIFLEATRQNASDIHFELNSLGLKVRYRIDGVLRTARNLKTEIAPLVINRLKVMANLNIVETRLPQDGHIEIDIEGDKYDLRISTVPVCVDFGKQGESVALRLFNASSKNASLESLGFNREVLTELEKVLYLQNGIVLFSGPTGSGKTTTMHALLEKMDREHRKIIAIEDPVEKIVKDVCQIQVREEIGLTFEKVLRRVLRQDPNVILIGEIRDRETAQLALRASLTGHLILATIHANDSVSCVERLKNFGLEPYLISSVLKLCVAQRLVRKLNQEKTDFCGRTVISEVFVVDEANSKGIAEGKTLSVTGKTLLDDAQEKVLEKITSYEEIFKEGLVK